MRDIKELNARDLEEALAKWGKPTFHARQIFSWIYQKGACDFIRMSDLSAELRKLLTQNFYLCGLKLVTRQRSADGTEKFLFRLQDKNLIEAVNIPTPKRTTGCISSQVGCKFACRFCASGSTILAYSHILLIS